MDDNRQQLCECGICLDYYYETAKPKSKFFRIHNDGKVADKPYETITEGKRTVYGPFLICRCCGLLYEATLDEKGRVAKGHLHE